MTFPINPIYKLHKDPHSNTVISVRKNCGTHELGIPFDEANTDYQAYLLWVSEGNTAEAAD